MDMVYTWAADTALLMDEKQYEAYYRQIPKWRQEKADRIRMREDRALCRCLGIVSESTSGKRAFRKNGL